MTLSVPTEAQEGKHLVAYLRIRGVPFTKIANETGRNARWQGIRNKQQGLSPGFPDYLCFPNSQIVAIELKRRLGGKLSPKQMHWQYILRDAGIPTFVCNGFDEARKVIDSYLVLGVK